MILQGLLLITQKKESLNAGYTLNEILPKHNTIVDGKEILNHVSSSKNLQKFFSGIKNAVNIFFSDQKAYQINSRK